MQVNSGRLVAVGANTCGGRRHSPGSKGVEHSSMSAYLFWVAFRIKSVVFAPGGRLGVILPVYGVAACAASPGVAGLCLLVSVEI